MIEYNVPKGVRCFLNYTLNEKDKYLCFCKKSILLTLSVTLMVDKLR
jgi:hypothetical protein